MARRRLHRRKARGTANNAKNANAGCSDIASCLAPWPGKRAICVICVICGSPSCCLIQPETDMARHPCDPRFGLVAANGCAVVNLAFLPLSGGRHRQTTAFGRMHSGNPTVAATVHDSATKRRQRPPAWGGHGNGLRARIHVGTSFACDSHPRVLRNADRSREG